MSSMIAKMFAGMGGPATPADPGSPPPPPPRFGNAQIKIAGEQAAASAAKNKGMGGTILTSPQGLASPAVTGQKTLLGQ